MTAYELISITLSIGNRIDIQWGMFITVHMALFGAIIYVDRPLRTPEKIAAMFVYSGFAVINYIIMNNLFIMLGQAYADIVIISENVCCELSNLIQGVANEASEGKSESTHSVLLLSHILMFALVVVSIILDQAITLLTSTKKDESKPE